MQQQEFTGLVFIIPSKDSIAQGCPEFKDVLTVQINYMFR